MYNFVTGNKHSLCPLGTYMDAFTKSATSPRRRILGGNQNKLKSSNKSHTILNRYPTMCHFVTEMCTLLLQNDVLWDIGMVHCGICAINLQKFTLGFSSDFTFIA